MAQGSPISPTLSTIVLVPLILLNSKAKSIFYADDGLLYSNEEFNPSDILDILPPEAGILVHAEGEKRRWVKFNGKWLCELKFLFIILNIDLYYFFIFINNKRFCTNSYIIFINKSSFVFSSLENITLIFNYNFSIT